MALNLIVDPHLAAGGYSCYRQVQINLGPLIGKLEGAVHNLKRLSYMSRSYMELDPSIVLCLKILG
jgi:hypothetical protein